MQYGPLQTIMEPKLFIVLADGRPHQLMLAIRRVSANNRCATARDLLSDPGRTDENPKRNRPDGTDGL